MFAAESGSVTVVNLLLRNFAQIDLQNEVSFFKKGNVNVIVLHLWRNIRMVSLR